MIAAGERDQRFVARCILRQSHDCHIEVEQQRPLRILATRLWTQKTEATRVPRVTGVTRCRLVDG